MKLVCDASESLKRDSALSSISHGARFHFHEWSVLPIMVRSSTGHQTLIAYSFRKSVIWSLISAFRETMKCSIRRSVLSVVGDESYFVCHYRSLNAGSPVPCTVFLYRFIERHQSDVIVRILRHCDLWKETPTRAPPVELPVPPQQLAGSTLDYNFFSSLAS